MTSENTALAGLHTRMTAIIIGGSLREAGYAVTEEATVAAMLRQCSEQRFGLYVMDVNLGTPGVLDIAPGQQVHAFLQESGLADRLYVLSNSDDLVRFAQGAGMQAYLTIDFTTDTLRGIISGRK